MNRVAICAYSDVRKLPTVMELCEIRIEGHMEGIIKLDIMDLWQFRYNASSVWISKCQHCMENPSLLTVPSEEFLWRDECLYIVRVSCFEYNHRFLSYEFIFNEWWAFWTSLTGVKFVREPIERRSIHSCWHGVTWKPSLPVILKV